MPADLSSSARELRALKSEAALNNWKGRVAMLFLNYIPLTHVVALAGVFFVPTLSNWGRSGTLLAVLYLFPPLIARILLFCSPIRSERIEAGSREFFTWWAMFQFQVLFCRMPFLEEVLRIVPGLYSQWLRLWGAKIGRFTYWSAGTLITDRSFLKIGNDVVFGAGVRLNSHVISKDDNGCLELLLAPIDIGDRALIGGYSLLTAGTKISADETTRAFLISPPFSEWKGGKRIRNDGEQEA